MLELLEEIFSDLDQMYINGRKAEAVKFLQTGAQRVNHAIGKESIEYTAILNEQGGLYREMGQYPLAEAAFQEAAATLEALQKRPAAQESLKAEYATTLNNLAGVYRLTKEFQRSKTLFSQALDLYGQTLGEAHFLYTSALNNMGLLYQDMGDYQQAMVCHRRALNILKERDDKKPAYATSLHNLSYCCRALGDFEQAKGLLLEAQGIYKEKVGEGHPLYKGCCFSLDEVEGQIFQQKILAMEWQMFIQVKNLGGTATCQRDPVSFRRMRQSHLMTWPLEMLKSYDQDLVEANGAQRNLMTEKYARMMAVTAPGEYAALEDVLPPLSPEVTQLVKSLCQIILPWEEAVHQKYKFLNQRGRATYQKDAAASKVSDTSFEVYLSGELSVYSARTLRLYEDYLLELQARGVNGSLWIYDNMMRLFGYDGLDGAQVELS